MQVIFVTMVDAGDCDTLVSLNHWSSCWLGSDHFRECSVIFIPPDAIKSNAIKSNAIKSGAIKSGAIDLDAAGFFG
jgi:hypothetical protein